MHAANRQTPDVPEEMRERFATALKAGNVKSIDEVLQVWPQLVDQLLATRTDGLLHLFVAEGRIDTVRLLLDRGVDPDGLHQALYVETVDLFPRDELRDKLQREFGGSKKDLKATPLEVAAFSGHAAIASLLLQHGARYERFATGEGGNAVHYAALRGHVEVLEVLATAGASLDVAGLDGQTPLRIAARRRHQAAATCILDRGGDLEAETEFETANSVARQLDRPELLESLTPAWEKLRNAVLARNAESVSHLAQAHQTAANARKGPMRDGALHLAADLGDAEIVQVLLAAGANPNLADADQKTPLHRAILAYRPAVVRILVTHGADPNCRTRVGYTALDIIPQDDELSALLRSAGARKGSELSDEASGLERAPGP